MSNLYWLAEEQMARLRPYFSRSHGKPRADDRRVLGGIVFFNRNGLRWCDAPKDYGLHKTLYNRWKRWGEKGIFLQIMEGLAAAGAEPKTVMIDATYLKARRRLIGVNRSAWHYEPLRRRSSPRFRRCVERAPRSGTRRRDRVYR